MIKELSYYLKTNRFSQIVEEFNTLINEYKDSFGSNKTGDPILREKVRAFCETQLVKSGICNNENSFINVDTEFFDNGQFAEANANRFIKDIVKAHCYQKVLWEYMGTTSLMTDISKDKMKADGFVYTDYLPSELKQKEISRQKKSITRNFSKLNDNSGFNWNKGYDPNDVVIKKGWAGSFDENHVWTYHKIDKSGKAYKTDKQVNNPVAIRLIKTPQGCMLYDSGDLLFNPLILLYLNQNNEVYGGTKSDTEKLLEDIRSQMKVLNVQAITEIYSTNTKTKAADYKNILSDLASPNLIKINHTKAAKILKNNKDNEKEVFINNQSKELQNKINVLLYAKPQITSEEIVQAMQSNVVSIPVISSRKEDSAAVNLNDEEFEIIQGLAKNLSGKKKTSFYNTCAVLSYKWNTYKSSGLSKTECIRHLYDYINNKTEYDFSYEISLQNLINSVITSDSSLEQAINYYMPEENKEDALSYVKTIPEQKEDIKDKVFSALHNAIKNYKSIRMSTGMNIKELFDYSIKHSGGILPKQSYVPPALGYVNSNTGSEKPDNAIGSKRIYFENKISSLYEALLSSPLPQKNVSLQQLQKEFENKAKQKPVVQIKVNSSKSRDMLYPYAEDSVLSKYGKKYFDFLQDYFYDIEAKADKNLEDNSGYDGMNAYIIPAFRQMEIKESAILPHKLHLMKSKSNINGGIEKTHVLRLRQAQGFTSTKADFDQTSYKKVSKIPVTLVKDTELQKETKHVNADPKQLTPEEQRLSRINANYERDRAALAKSDPTFMAKNQFWDVGHAQESGEMSERNIHKIAMAKANEKKSKILK